MNEVLRQEKKYLMNVLDTHKMINRLEQIMLQDPHNGAEGYRIRSLYFDTPFDQDFYEKVKTDIQTSFQGDSSREYQ